VQAVNRILGHADDAQFAGRSVDRLRIDSALASRRRLRATSEDGLDVAVDLPRGAYLAEGAVLADDGERILVVERVPEPALLIRFSPNLDAHRLVEQVARVAHAFGNQHVPLEADGLELRVPITTSAEVAEQTVSALALDGVSTEVATVPLGRARPIHPGHVH
jgi:urease accessory protein